MVPGEFREEYQGFKSNCYLVALLNRRLKFDAGAVIEFGGQNSGSVWEVKRC